jgi:hypothetical protein
MILAGGRLKWGVRGCLSDCAISSTIPSPLTISEDLFSKFMTSKEIASFLDAVIMSFSTIPILDLSLAKDPTTKPQFLDELRHALLEVGFLYLKNVGIPSELTQAVIKEGVSFFDLPMEEKYLSNLRRPSHKQN